jgi:hypothetical protein
LHGGTAERRAVGNSRLWQVFWLGGAALAVLTGLLLWAAERAYTSGHSALEALADVTRIVLYLVWFKAAWRCSRNVEHAAWSPVARAVLLLGLAATALLV